MDSLVATAGDRGRILLSSRNGAGLSRGPIVWTAEALNTAFEFLADAASPNFHPVVRDAKDVAAGAVLITALRVISDRRNHSLATCEGPVGRLTRSTHAEIFVMSREYVIPTHLLLFSRQTNS